MAPFCLNDVLDTVKVLMTDKEKFLKVFKPIALQFCERETCKDEDDLFTLSEMFLKTVTVKSSHEDPEFVEHHLAEALVSPDKKDQIILLNLSMFKIAENATPAEADRVFFVLLVKVLHELCHCLTPIFNRWAGLAANTPTPVKLGSEMGDCGLGLETILFGGRVQLCRAPKKLTPSAFEVRLLRASRAGHNEYALKDTYITRVLTYFSPGGGLYEGVPLDTLQGIYVPGDDSASDMWTFSTWKVLTTKRLRQEGSTVSPKQVKDTEIMRSTVRPAIAYYEGKLPAEEEENEVTDEQADVDGESDDAPEEEQDYVTESEDGDAQSNKVLMNYDDLSDLLDATACEFDESYRSPVSKHRKF